MTVLTLSAMFIGLYVQHFGTDATNVLKKLAFRILLAFSVTNTYAYIILNVLHFLPQVIDHILLSKTLNHTHSEVTQEIQRIHQGNKETTQMIKAVRRNHSRTQFTPLSQRASEFLK